MLGAVHAIAFWFSVSFFTPFILLVAFFNERRRLLHDIVLGTVVINNAARAAAMRARSRRRDKGALTEGAAARDARQEFVAAA